MPAMAPDFRGNIHAKLIRKHLSNGCGYICGDQNCAMELPEKPVICYRRIQERSWKKEKSQKKGKF
ncbi:MAG: hypothetical protein V8T13_09005 [[Ruminococcus] lactaris]